MPAPALDLHPRLLDDRVDVVGDVHGEIESLRALLAGLGCDVERARVERPIVFVGDLIDRGPDSVAVVELVEHLVRSGVAQIVLGNHEFNLLRGDRKEGNGWFFPGDDRVDGWHDKGALVPFPSRVATASEQARIRAFLETMPLTLESPSLRVVHAAWSSTARSATAAATSLAEVLDLDAEPASGRLAERFVGAPTMADITNPLVRPAVHEPFARALAEAQNADPAKVLTSGLERPVPPGAEPHFIAGKWRLTERDPWWESDDDERPVVFGHYWRRRSAGGIPFKASVFGETPPNAWFGKRAQAFCVDYSVGYRFRARHHGTDDRRDFALAALRMPEALVRFDDGSAWTPTARGR
jgi:Calcineurin-like phosphoesterase